MFLQFCLYFLVKFCPHDLFVNTRADLGACPKIHDEEAKKLYDEARPSKRKRNYEDEFLRFSNHMLNEVDRKISKGKQRLLLMNKGDGAPVYVSKFQEQLNNLNARIKKLIGEAEEAGNFIWVAMSQQNKQRNLFQVTAVTSIKLRV